MFDIVLIGAGPSSYAFLKGLEKSEKFKNKKIALILSSKTKTNIQNINIDNVSPKFLQHENLKSLSYYLDGFKNSSTENFTHIGIHGIGGMARIWGGSIGTFNKSALDRNNIDYNCIKSIYYDMAEFLPYRGNCDDLLMSDFDLPRTTCVKVANKLKKLYGKSNNLRIGTPRLLVKDNCNNCNQCLIGCETDSVWYPTINDFLNISNINLHIIKDSFATNIQQNTITINTNDVLSSIDAKLIVLGCGALQNYKLLTTLNISNKKAKILTTPAIAFAFFDFTKNSDSSFFGMGNASFAITKNDQNIFYGNLYDGYSLSLSKGKVFSKNSFKDTLMKAVARYMVAGAGFMSSDNANCSIDTSNNNISIKANFNNLYEETCDEIISELKNFAQTNYKPLAHIKKAALGADIHYAGAIPDELFDINLAPNGKLKNVNNVLVIGGSTFSYLPPESPTLSYMANSYRIAKNLDVKMGL